MEKIAELPNMAGAFDSHSAHWKPGHNAEKTLEHAAEAMAETLKKVYASGWNDRGIDHARGNNGSLDRGAGGTAVRGRPTARGARSHRSTFPTLPSMRSNVPTPMEMRASTPTTGAWARASRTRSGPCASTRK
mgnify:CR=1 FL=1